ncbi:hypothetical protein P154DRAFT_518070 [Amniculicola lignicola CBS 123094]|uniref:Uncharacterized protein n=1 Tax=Amniculicola lignicola CBS 123094 TaxID=1392246 RepID=A0A6A5X1P1_9PLEO|nr:hypothetical protein P154DRAFT_518070 [Amniculicola lignicola CBS 123094]
MCNISRTLAEHCGHPVAATINRCQVAEQRGLHSCEDDYDLLQDVVYDDSHQVYGTCERCHLAGEGSGDDTSRSGSPAMSYGSDQGGRRMLSRSTSLGSLGSERSSPTRGPGDFRGSGSRSTSVGSAYSGSAYAGSERSMPGHYSRPISTSGSEGSFGVGRDHSDIEPVTHMSGGLGGLPKQHGNTDADIERLLRETAQEHQRREEEELEAQIKRALEASAHFAPIHPHHREEEELAAALEASKLESSARQEDDEEEQLRKALEASKADNPSGGNAVDEEEQLRKALEASRLELNARHAVDEEAQLAAALAASKLSSNAYQEEDEEEAVRRVMAESAAMYSHSFGGHVGAMGDSDEEMERIKQQSMKEWHSSLWTSPGYQAMDPDARQAIDLDPHGKGKGRRNQPPTPVSEEEERDWKYEDKHGGNSKGSGRGGQRKPGMYEYGDW